MADPNQVYYAKCPHCGQVDIVYGGQKTHKCSSCGTRNKLDFDDSSMIVGQAENPVMPQFLQVACPYCGTVDIVPIEEKRHHCSVCHRQYEVIYDDGTKQEKEKKKTVSFLSSDDNKSGKKLNFKAIFIVAAIIIAVVSLFSLIPDMNSDPTPTKTDSYVMSGVRTYLMENLKDPSSYQDLEWSPSGVNSNGQYYIRHKYRAKNSFGATVVEQKIFYLDKSCRVVNSHDY